MSTEQAFTPLGGKCKKKGSLTLNSVKNTRLTLARILRAYHNGELDAEKYRNLVYGLSTLAGLFKAEMELAEAERLARIEKALEDLKK